MSYLLSAVVLVAIGLVLLAATALVAYCLVLSLIPLPPETKCGNRKHGESLTTPPDPTLPDRMARPAHQKLRG